MLPNQQLLFTCIVLLFNNVKFGWILLGMNRLNRVSAIILNMELYCKRDKDEVENNTLNGGNGGKECNATKASDHTSSKESQTQRSYTQACR